MEKQIINNFKKIKYFIKGSGNSHCLLNGSDQDQNNFTEYNLSDFINTQNELIVIDFAMAGLYLIILIQTGQTYILGNFGQKIFQKPQPCFFSLNMKIKIIQIKSGWQHSILKSQDQRLFGLGSNKFQQLGFQINQKFVQSLKQLNLPDKIGKIDTFQCGFRQTYYARNNRVFGCGQSKKYELGLQNCKSTSWIQIQICQKQKQQEEKLLKFTKISCTKKAAFFISNKHQLFALGWNDHNLFNLSTSKEKSKYQQQTKYLSKITKINRDVMDIQCGWNHLVLIKNLQSKNSNSLFFLQSYGRNNFCQLGREILQEKNQNEIKMIFFDKEKPQSSFNFFQKQPYIYCGTEFSFCINDDGTRLYGWGWNQHHNIIQSQEKKFIKQPTQIFINMKNSTKQQNFQQNTLTFKRVWTYPAITLVECQISQNK